MKRKRFWVFAGADYYPEGGMFDYISSHDTAAEAMEAARLELVSNNWTHVLDSEAEDLDSNLQNGVQEIRK